jgi:4'-phosphopantetheinyl transferase EntD
MGRYSFEGVVVTTLSIPTRVEPHHLDLLGPGERTLVTSAGSEHRRRELVGGRLAGIDALGASSVARPQILMNSEGRPVLEPPDGRHISIAHDAGVAVAAVGDAPVGVDVIPLARQPQARRVVDEHISKARGVPLDGHHRPWPQALMLWTAWEALGKQSGHGVLGGASLEHLSPAPGPDGTALAAAGSRLVRWWVEGEALLCLATRRP